MSYEPYNFKGHLDDFPLTMDYGKKMDALRCELRDYFWDGEFRHDGRRDGNNKRTARRIIPTPSSSARRGGVPGVAIANYEDESSYRAT